MSVHRCVLFRRLALRTSLRVFCQFVGLVLTRSLRLTASFADLTTEIHQQPEFRNVFALEALNEPIQSSSGVGNMISSYYPGVLNTVCQAESALGVSPLAFRPT